MLVKVKTSQEAYEMGYTEAKYGLKKENPFDKMKQSKFWNHPPYSPPSLQKQSPHAHSQNGRRAFHRFEAATQDSPSYLNLTQYQACNIE